MTPLEQLHNQFFFAEMETDDQDIIVSFQVQNRKTDWNYQQSIKCSKTKSEMVNENSQDADVETPEILSSTQLLEGKIIGSNNKKPIANIRGSLSPNYSD
jgi:hypothetical protein